MNRNKLMELTPDKWGLFIYLSESGMLDLNRVKIAMKDIANSRLEFAEETLNRAKELKDANPTDRLIINRAYYCMYHAARAAVYVQLQLDVEKHQALIDKFEKLLLREFSDTTLSDQMDKWRIRRNKFDYNPKALMKKKKDLKCITNYSINSLNLELMFHSILQEQRRNKVN